MNIQGDEFTPELINLINIVPSAIGLLLGNDFRGTSSIFFNANYGNALVLNSREGCEKLQDTIIHITSSSLSTHPSWRLVKMC